MTQPGYVPFDSSSFLDTRFFRLECLPSKSILNLSSISTSVVFGSIASTDHQFPLLTVRDEVLVCHDLSFILLRDLLNKLLPYLLFPDLLHSRKVPLALKLYFCLKTLINVLSVFQH